MKTVYEITDLDTGELVGVEVVCPYEWRHN